MFMARPGHVLVICDYSFIELCTLAVVCEKRFGFSMLGTVIRQGIDPHCFTAAMFEKVPLDQFMTWKTSEDPVQRSRFKNLRQRAKAINFGIPGGEGAQALQEYAKSAYGVTLTIEESQQFREALIRKVYPELSCYLFEDCMDRLAERLGVPVGQCWTRFAKNRPKHPSIGLAIRNITEGVVTRSDGKPYRQKWVEGIWRGLRQLNKNQSLRPLIDKYYGIGNAELAKKLFGSQVATPTGRLRGGVTFTQSCNTPFSGLAADGAKLAMYNLYQIGFRLVAFIHDEIVVEVPEDGDLDADARLVDQVMCESMQEVTGDIPIKCECCLSRRWSKGAAPVYDEHGKLCIWEPDDRYRLP